MHTSESVTDSCREASGNVARSPAPHLLLHHSTSNTVTSVANNNHKGTTSAAPANALGVTSQRECAGCNKVITERFLLRALDLFWHEDCLKCGCCDCRLGEVGSTLYTKANLILCKRDYLRLFGTTGYCAACNKVIPAFEMVMRAKSNVYHLECFACQQCNHRFCVGDRFYLCDNKILCEYDYEERLVFANMAYNPSSLAHIRRQVCNLQPAGDSIGNCGAHAGRLVTPPMATVEPGVASMAGSSGAVARGPCFGEKPQLPPAAAATSNMGPPRDDGSSGYGSPDSETFESPQTSQ
ncbi:LIM/homeobox protein Lhx9-like [Phlebotomus argentipes]|uniref:LIM/homeobox protein Lhx9-like n=1 Tax=Phlebotomus argentipes TaxID=94469 RepID=UPI0028936B77|nr:LIM/homeobox protein Lhx9-like [Phlebotomus argentipes]XP_059622703.1 LIM/homeobox protein Lhx9-like [Phlebotomus argentipes]